MLELLQQLHWGVLFQIILIDILLGGDNALVIALACRNLDPKKRRAGIFWGTFAAVALRIALVFFALSLLATPFLKIVGAVLLLWIDRKSTRLNSSHVAISYAVFCLKKKNEHNI